MVATADSLNMILFCLEQNKNFFFIWMLLLTLPEHTPMTEHFVNSAGYAEFFSEIILQDM